MAGSKTPVNSYLLQSRIFHRLAFGRSISGHGLEPVPRARARAIRAPLCNVRVLHPPFYTPSLI